MTRPWQRLTVLLTWASTLLKALLIGVAFHVVAAYFNWPLLSKAE